ncbi:conserved repeat domain-containing protein/gliding motility-associated C-terminal domain-containing protein [Pedobacter caeni]|uniref:Conserved repeat domain-containing protein/gliding motility-associated C-terminal domain-containing protein n=2 Tax=Pedobacter caeni TaxID=288992 RepID=A0A1M5PTV1_9SPHI|nr:conserved repeat domain-containing protein/gliding motility-associated C-terminal domain-containing protein [Pedobacter caeni]
MCFLFAVNFNSYADGSKDLYPQGKRTGGRAFLYSNSYTGTTGSSMASWPFKSLGVHYAYLKAGEVIYASSSAQGVGNGRIRLTAPDGTTSTSANDAIGKIASRTEENAGPRFDGQSGGSYYTAFSRNATQEGIWKIEFLPTGSETSTATPSVTAVLADDNWTQGGNTELIAAWDVSVRNPTNTAWLPGRVYANVLNLHISGSSFAENNGFYGLMQVLTKDGYVYKVDNNGNNGVGFTFFVNNKGFLDNKRDPIYKSLDKSKDLGALVQDPRAEDTQSDITHKIFYVRPGNDLPLSANGAVPGQQTWLKNNRLEPKVDNLGIIGVDGTDGQVSNKGGNIKFDANLSGRYKITISSPYTAPNPNFFVTRVMEGNAIIGTNKVLWDGKDGAGQLLPSGSVPAKLVVQLQGAEVHFPYIDMEINPKGIKLQLLDIDNTTVKSDYVYWNDFDISQTGPAAEKSNPINASQNVLPNGTSSGGTEGHRWGTYVNGGGSGGGNSGTGSSSFGNEKSMDTWSFILGAEETKNITVAVKVADLEVTSITPSKTIVGKGDELAYTVVVKNNGPSDVTGAPFSFKVPAGFTVTKMEYVSACGTETVPVVFDPTTGLCKSTLTLPNGCVGQYVFTGTVGSTMVSGNMEVWATIMRPRDVTDIDATNPDPNIPPTDPYFECKEYDPLSGLFIPCNNIKKNNTATIINKITATKSIEGNPAKVKAGDVLIYNIILKNTNGTDKTGVNVSDVLPAGLIGATAISHSGSLTGTTINWTNLTVPANGELKLKFTTTVGSDLTGITSIKNVASVVDPIDPTTPLTPEVVVPVDLVRSFTAIKKVAAGLQNNKIVAGSIITYSIEVENTGSTTLTNIEIADNIPAHTTYVAASADNSGVLTGSTLKWLVDVPVGLSKIVTFKVKVADNLTGVAEIKNIATVTDPTKPLTPVNPEVIVPTDPVKSFTTTKIVSGGLQNNKIVAGSTITYSIEVKNTGSADLTGVKISDVIPGHTTFKTSDNGGILTGNTLNWTVDVPFGTTKTVNFNVEVAKDLTGVTAIKNIATVTGPGLPPVNPEIEVPTDPTRSFTTTKIVSGGLQNNKIVAGSTITYSIEVKNTGSTTLTNIEIADNIPANTTYVVASADNSGVLTGSTLKWLVDVPVGLSKIVTFKVKVADNLTGVAEIKNIATVTDPTKPLTPANPEVTVPTDPLKSFTAVKKISGGLQNNKIVAGSTITYSIEVKNTGSTNLTGVKISDVIPAHTTYKTSDNGGALTGNTLNWTVDVPFGTTKTVNFDVEVAKDLTGVTAIKNTATVTDPSLPPVNPEVEVPTDPTRSFTTTKIVSGGLQNNKIVAGSTITYSIEVKNTGSTALTSIAIADNIPANTTYVAASADNSGVLTGSTLNWLVDVPVGLSKIVTFKVKVADNLTGVAEIKNIATVTDPTKPLTPVNPEVIVPTDPVKSFTTTKIVSGGLQNNKIVAGSTITYSIEVKNTGSTDLTGVKISDVIPGHTTFKTSDNGGILTGNTLNWTVDVPFGTTKTVNFNVEVAKDLTGVTAIKNIATVTGPGLPPVNPEIEVPTDPTRSFTTTKIVSGGLQNNKIVAGSTITYSIEVKNTGSTTLTNIAIADNIPANTTYVAASADNSGVLTGSTLNWLVDVPVGLSKIVTFKVKVADNLTGVVTIKNVATVTDPTKPTPVNPEVEVPTDPVKSFTAAKKISGGLQNNKIVAGSTITYSIEVKNTGSTDLTGVRISDVIPAHTTYKTSDHGGALTGNTLNWTVDVPFGQTTTVNFDVEVAKDLTGVTAIKNTATVTDPDLPPVNPEVEVPTDPVRSFTATKKISGGLQNNKIVAGSIITYSIEVKNTGSTALTNIGIADNLPSHTTYVDGTADLGGSLTGSTLNWVVNLAFGETKTVSFQVKVADDLTGVATIKNAAIVTDPTKPLTPVTPEVEVPTDPVRSFTATKKISGGLQNNKIVAGSILTYSIEVKNTGSTALTNIAIADNIPSHTTYVNGTADLGGSLTGSTLNWVVNLAFGETKTVNFQVKVADNLTGVADIKNTATVTDPTKPLTPVTPEVTVPTDPVRSFTAIKKISGGLQNNKIVAGSIITYNIEVKNTGSTALTNIAIADNLPNHTTYVDGTANLGGSLTGSTLNWVVNLAFGETKTVSFQVKVADNLTGVATIKNAATVTDPTKPVTPVTPEVEVPTDAKRSFTSAKRVVSGLVNGEVPAEGELVYAIDVVNTGGEDLIGLTITDDLPVGTSFVRADQNGSKNGNQVSWTIDVPFGQTKTVLLTLKVAADLTNVETIVNKATVTDPKDPTNPKVPEVTVPTVQKAAITLSKTAIAGTHQKLGDIINYNLVVKNTGNVTVKNIIITDDNADAGSISPANIASLAPNATVNITAKHTLTQSDLDRGFVSNLAKADGKDPKGKDVHAESKDPSPVPGGPTDPACKDCTITPTDQKPAITLSKTAVAGDHKKVGDVISYNLVLKNTGNVTVKNIVITDDNADAGSISPATIASLVPNATINITAKHTLTQADLDRGFVSNIAKADGKDPKGGDVHAESKDPSPVPGAPTDPACKDCTITPTDQKGALSLSKTAVAGTHNKIGDVINYNLVLKNTGNVTLKNILITDDNADAGSISPATIASLAPNAMVNISAKHTLTQEDLDRGFVSNLAKADGKDPKGKDVHAESKDPSPVPGAPTDPGCKDCTITPTDQKGALSLSKTAVAGTHNKVGDVINYKLVLKNTGNVTLKNIIITDDNADAGSISPANIASLAPNATVNITAKHTLTQADLDRGSVSNLAKADGKDPKGGDVHAESKDPSPVPGAPVDPGCKDCTVTPTEQVSGINLVKKITNTGSGEQGAFVLNDKIEYTFIIKNTGNTTLTGISLNDPLLGASAIPVPGSLAPGESISHKEYYTITAADIAAGKVTNQATVTAKDPKGKEVSAISGTDAGNNNPTVIPLAKPPVAKDDLAKAEQNKPVKIEVQKNDEPGNSPIVPGSTKIITQPKNGTLTLNPDGTVTYTPNPGFTGTDEFVYTVTDKNGQISNPATVKVEVSPSKPVAIDDVAETPFNKEVEIPLLNNDKTDGAAFERPTVEIIEQPKNGVLKKNPDGTVVYVPNSGFTGKDSFTYKVKDANGNWTNVATANITIKGFFIPNVITPNGDGKNDEFVIVGLEEFNSAELTVFNRWGNEVYRNGNYRNTWTGEGLNEGTYYYLIRLKKDSKLEVYKGWVLIKR